jgi:hypothetical protein
MQGSTNGTVAAVLAHKLGTLRIHRTSDGSLHFEVAGFLCDEGRQFLRELANHAEDTICDVLVHDRPHEYGLTGVPLGPRVGHVRRRQ